MKHISIIIFCCVLSLMANAQQTLTLEQCRKMALENNKQMAISNKTMEKASREVKSYRANFLPKFSASGMYYLASDKTNRSFEGGYLPTFIPDANGNLIPNIIPGTEANPIFNQYALMPDIPIEFSMNNTWTAGVKLEQPIYAGGKINAAYRMSLLGKEMSEANSELTRTEVIVESDNAYWSYVKVRELHISALSYKNVVSELLQNITNAYDAGLKQPNDVLKVQVKLNEAELQVQRVENAISLTRMNLCYVIGLPLTTDLNVSESFSDDDITLSTHELPIADITSRPEYTLLNKQIDMKKQEVKLTQSDYLPNIGVMVGYNYLDGFKLNNEKLVSKGSVSALVSVNIPIFEWGKGINKVKAARLEESIAKLQQQDIEEKMILEIAQAQNVLDEAVLEVKLTSLSALQAEENMRISKDFYEQGLETLANYLEAQTIWQKANNDYVDARAKLELSKTQYLKAAGRL